MVTDVFGQTRVLTDSERTAPSTQISDVTDIAARAWAQALSACAKRVGLESPAVAVGRIRQGDSLVRMQCCHGLAEQISASLWSSHYAIQAVFAPECDSCPQHFCLENGAAHTPLAHLLVWEQHRTTALRSWTASLGNALAGICQDIFDLQELPTSLSVQVIDDADLAKLFGAGHRERWPIRLQAYFLAMNESIEELYPRATSP
jgi:hypothetical protein